MRLGGNHKFRPDKYELEELQVAPHPTEPVCCSHFGCGRTLTLQEQLAGDRCVNHQRRKQQDITLIINKS